MCVCVSVCLGLKMGHVYLLPFPKLMGSMCFYNENVYFRNSLLVLWSFADKTYLTQKYTQEPVLVEQMHSTDSPLARVGQCCEHNLTKFISVQGGQNPRC